MDRFFGIDEKNNFVDRNNEDLYKKYNITKEGLDLNSTLPFNFIKEYKKGANRYFIYEDIEGNIIPLYYKKVNDTIIVKPIAKAETRRKIFEEIIKDSDIMKDVEVVENEEVIEDTREVPEETIEPVKEDNPETSEVDENVNYYEKVEEIRGIKKRQKYFATIPYAKQLEIIDKLLQENNENEASILLNNKYLTDFYIRIEPEKMKEMVNVVYKNADNLHGKDKNDLLNDVSHILGLYPDIIAFYQTLSDEEKDKFYNVLPPKQLKIIYKNCGEEAQKDIDEYLISKMVYSSELITKTKSDKDALQLGVKIYNGRDKREEYPEKEIELFDLKTPSEKEMKHYQKVQEYVNKYNIGVKEGNPAKAIKVYDVSKVESIPFMDKIRFKYHQHAYLSKYDARAKQNFKKLKAKLKQDLSNNKDRYNEYDYMYKTAYQQHKAVHSLFKRKAFLKKLDSFRSGLGVDNPTLDELYKQDNPDLQIINHIRDLLREIERKNDEGVEIVEDQRIDSVESPTDEPIITESQEKVGFFKKVFGKLSKGKHSELINPDNYGDEETEERQRTTSM